MVPAREGKGDILYLPIYTINPQHKTHAGYLVCINDLGGEPQGNGSTWKVHGTNGEVMQVKQCILDATIMFYQALCYMFLDFYR